MSKSPGALMAEMIKKRMKGEDTSKLKDEFEKESCDALSSPGSKVTFGNYEAVDGQKAKRRSDGQANKADPKSD